jgi:hypothetical protein
MAAAVWSIPVKANLLSFSSYAFVDSSSRSWSGVTTYSSFSLTGSVEYVVFGPGQFNAAFPSSPYHPPANELVYAYQIDNAGTSDTSTLDQFIPSGPAHPVDTIGSFPLTYSGTGTGVSPSSSSFVPSPPSYQLAHWLFQGGLLTGQSSSGLAFASPNVPEDDFGSLANSGLGAGADPLPSPSTIPVPIPEPCTAALIAAATVTIGIRCRLRRLS